MCLLMPLVNAQMPGAACRPAAFSEPSSGGCLIYSPFIGCQGHSPVSDACPLPCECCRAGCMAVQPAAAEAEQPLTVALLLALLGFGRRLAPPRLPLRPLLILLIPLHLLPNLAPLDPLPNAARAAVVVCEGGAPRGEGWRGGALSVQTWKGPAGAASAKCAKPYQTPLHRCAALPPLAPHGLPSGQPGFDSKAGAQSGHSRRSTQRTLLSAALLLPILCLLLLRRSLTLQRLALAGCRQQQGTKGKLGVVAGVWWVRRAGQAQRREQHCRLPLCASQAPAA